MNRQKWETMWNFLDYNNTKNYVKALKTESGDTLERILNTETERLELNIIRE